EAAVLRKDRNTIRTGLRLLARRHPLSHSPGTFAPRDRDFVPAATTRERLHTQSVEPSGTRGRAGGGAQDGEHAGLDIFYGFWRPVVSPDAGAPAPAPATMPRYVSAITPTFCGAVALDRHDAGRTP